LTLNQIASGELKIGTFDFDGQKYRAKHSAKLVKQIDAELKVVDEKIKQNDMAIYRHFLSLEQANGNSPQLRELYAAFFAYHEEFNQLLELFNKMNNHLTFVTVETPYKTIEAKFRLNAEYEAVLKKNLTALLEDPMLQPDLDPELKKVLTEYLSKDWVYFEDNQYIDDALSILHQAIQGYGYLISHKYHLIRLKASEYASGIAC
jgi:hypothetical protein